MKNMFNTLILLSGISAFAVACDDRLSTQEAYSTCRAEQKKVPTIDDKKLLECVACYENCEECSLQTVDGEQKYLCPDQLPAEAAEETEE